ncbi:periplasmic heavy metal sensor [Rhodomicrobium vannielii ATCC 17100]|uniref:periplasmic heavy metal sensor n=1 Tax=Rhodomicrobium vannielii TaxID=1069 RepID=UPI001918B790|nr:periplasmic heavy metal sensor [Rhodomicrobium vannielii]MBJ7534313.1 periplasmic heavy metal sensor [Rhodomicrobium vannielii ATCC 17100]
MSAQDTIAAESRPRRGLIFWSLALNMFFICGVVAFSVASLYKPVFRGGGGGPAYQFERIAARLPAQDADRLRAAFAQRASEVDETHAASHKARDAMRLALRAEPYDGDATRKAMADAQEARRRLETVIQAVIASAAAEMSLEARAQLAEWRAEPPRK